MHLGSFTLKILIEAGPSLVGLFDRISAPTSAQWEQIMAEFTTIRERLDALRAGIEKTEALRADVERLEREKVEHAEVDRVRDEEEAEEDRLEVIEDTEAAETVRQYEESRATDRARIAELEASIADGTVLSVAERQELDELLQRLNQAPPEG